VGVETAGVDPEQCLTPILGGGFARLHCYDGAGACATAVLEPRGR
jgi:hypothetical protein